MTDAEKILSLLQSSEEKNRLLAFELMKDHTLKQDVYCYVSELTSFKFEEESEGAFSFYNKVSIYSQEALQPLCGHFEKIMLLLTPFASILRKAFNQFMFALIDLVEPSEGLACEISLTYKASIIHVKYDWTVDAQKKVFLEEGFQKAAKINARRYELQVLTTSRIGDPPDPDRTWKLLSHYMKNKSYEHGFTLISAQLYKFSLKLQIDLK